MVAIRENQTAAAARGIHATRLGVVGFTLSGIVAGLAGATYAFRQGIVVASVFPVSLSLTLVIWVVLGGLGSRWGVAAVATAFTLVDLYGSASNQLVTLIAAIGVVVLIGRHPLGAGGALRAAAQRRRDRRPVAADPPDRRARSVPDEAAGSGSRPALAPVAVRLPDDRRIRPVLLAARDVTVRFGGNVAIDGVSLDVFPGEVVGILGPNGAGKTTMFNVLSGFIQPSQGVVWFRGRDVSASAPPERTRLGLGRSFQQGGLWVSETAHANLLMAQYARTTGAGFGDAVTAAPAQGRLDRRRAAVADQVLEVLGLAGAGHRPVAELPYGHRKVLEIGCAVATRPSLLLLDEPAAGLHGAQSEWVAQAIAALRAELGITVVVIEHDVGLVRSVSDRIYVLDFGRLLTEGRPDEVLARPEVIAAYLGQAVEPGAVPT
jgi:ABC-type branched-subunit amino acid transport system ATPase component